MATRVFDRETLLDLTVNVIPLGIILFFIVAFAVVNPFGWDLLYSGLQFGILAFHFVALAVLTYAAGRVISRSETPDATEPPAAGETDRGSDTPEATERDRDPDTEGATPSDREDR